MSIEATDSGFDDLEIWLKSGSAAELQRDLEQKIMTFLIRSDHTDSQFQQMIEQLARIGTHPDYGSLLEKEIIELQRDAVVPCGFLKKAWKGTSKAGAFLWAHKTEIGVGIAICATGIGIAAVTGYTLSATVGGVVVAGAQSIFNSEDKPNPNIPQIPPPCSTTEIALYNQALSTSLPRLKLPSSSNQLFVTQSGIWAGGRFFPNPLLSQYSALQQAFGTSLPIQRGAPFHEGLFPMLSVSECLQSLDQAHDKKAWQEEFLDMLGQKD